MYHYEDCETMLEALTHYQSNVRLILINTTRDELRHELFVNDQEFLDYISGRLKNADSATDQEV